MKSLQFALLLSSCLAISLAAPRCPKNQQWIVGHNRSCEGSCEFPVQKLCPWDERDDAGQGCYCLPPFVLDDNFECIKLEDCPKQPEPEHKCPKNQTWIVGSKRPCEGSCDYPVQKVCPEDERDIAGEGCYCVPPLVLDDDYNCIKQEECPAKPEPVPSQQQCPKNQKWIVGSKVPCEGSCEYPVQKFCPEDMRQTLGEGCYCLPPFVLDDRLNCIKLEECIADHFPF